MNNFKVVPVILSVLLSLPVWASPGSELLLKAYLNEQATRQLELILPRGQFSLKVKVTPKKAVSESMKLPLGTATLTGDEMSTIETTGLESIGLLLSRIQKLEIDVGVAKTVPESIRQMIKSSLESALALQSRRGDVVTLGELPDGFAAVWNPKLAEDSEKKKEERTTLNSIEMTLAAIAGGFLILAAFIVFFAFRQTASRLSVKLD